MENLPFISVVIPCRNEDKFIRNCLDSILNQDYPKDKLEILVIDGLSQDKTKEIVEGYTKQFVFLKLLDNPKKITASALNIGIKNAKGDFILWMSAHNYYEFNYISKCINVAMNLNVDNVGGIIIPLQKKQSFIGKCIINVLSSPFGVGNSRFRIPPKRPLEVDTVFGGCYKKEVFNKIGYFNEDLVRGQDMEFNLRLKKAGGKILLIPDIKSYYYARTDLKSFIKYNFINGLWAIMPFKYTNIVPVSLRHLVPLGFVLCLFIFLILSMFLNFFWGLFLFTIVSYAVINLFFSFCISVREKDLRLLFLMPVIFVSFHLSYGLGSVSGLINVILSKQFWKNLYFMINNG